MTLSLLFHFVALEGLLTRIVVLVALLSSHCLWPWWFILSSDLTLNAHVEAIYHKCLPCFMFYYSQEFNSPHCLKILLFIRSLVEYGITIFSPSQQGLIQLLSLRNSSCCFYAFVHLKLICLLIIVMKLQHVS